MTLQELLAPQNILFFDRDWNFIGKKQELKVDLWRATGIHEDYLLGKKEMKDAIVATRMSWMAGRVTVLIEDVAYSMLGILDVNIPPEYDEGVKAFMRLQRVLMESSNDESISAWTTCREDLRRYSRTGVWEPNSWGLSAPSPDCFGNSCDLVETPQDDTEVRLGGRYRWTQQDVQFQVPQKSGTDATNWLGLPRKKIDFALNCRREENGQAQTVVIYLLKDGNAYKRVRLQGLEFKTGGKPSTDRVLGVEQGLTRPLTV